MISYTDALNTLRREAPRRVGTETLGLREARSRVFSKDIVSQCNNPPFTNSAMDGFAIRYGDVEKGTGTFNVVSTLIAGDAPSDHQKRFSAQGSCVEIMTGAPVPSVYDTVIKVEDVQRDEGSITLKRTPRLGDHVRKAGEDFLAGELLYKQGQSPTPYDMLLLSAAGVCAVPVYRRLRVALLATGKELVDAGAGELKPGQIRNSSSMFLNAYLNSAPVDVIPCGIIDDEPERFMAVMENLEQNPPDLILSTGAVSMGKHDFIASALKDLGARLLFHKTAIRPGKPILCAQLKSKTVEGDNTLYFGLPGNPVSTCVGVRFFVEPTIRFMLGQAPEPSHCAVLLNAFGKPQGLRFFAKAHVSENTQGQRHVTILSQQSSAQVRPLGSANAWAVIGEDEKDMPKDSVVEVYPLCCGGSI